MIRQLSRQPSDQAARHACWRHGSHINRDRGVRRRNDGYPASTFASSAQTCRERNCSPSNVSNVPKLQHWQCQIHEHSHGMMSFRLSTYSQQHSDRFASRSFSSKMPKKIDLRSILRQPVDNSKNSFGLPEIPPVSVPKQEEALTGAGGAPRMGHNLSPLVLQRLQDLVSSGFCTQAEISEQITSKIKMLSEQEALDAINNLSSVDRNQIRQFSGYFMAILNRFKRGKGALHQHKAGRSNSFSGETTYGYLLSQKDEKSITPVSVAADPDPAPKQEEAQTYGDILLQKDRGDILHYSQTDIKKQNANPIPKQEEVSTDENLLIQRDSKEKSIAHVFDYVDTDHLPGKEEMQTYEELLIQNDIKEKVIIPEIAEFHVLPNEEDSSRTRLFYEEPPNKTQREGLMYNVSFVDGPATQFGSGVIATLCHGSIVGTAGSTVVLSTVVLDSPSEAPNFGNSGMVPLQVEYRERHHGVGRIPTNSRRRDNSGPMTDDEILAARAIDRVLRPLLPKESYSSTLAITCSVQACGRHSQNIVNNHQANPTSGDPVVLAINSASAALVQSGLPFEGPVGCVRLCLIDGNIVQDPTPAQLEDSLVELLYAGTHDRALMLELSSRKKPDVSSYDENSSYEVGISESVVADMIRLAHSAIQPLIDAQSHLSPNTEEFDDYALAMDLGIPCVPVDETNVISATTDRSKQDMLYQQVVEEAYEFIHEKLGPVALRLFGVDETSTPNIKPYEKYAVVYLQSISKTSPLISKRIRGRREHLVRNEIRRLLREDFNTKNEERQLLTGDVLNSSLDALTDVIHERLLRWALAKCTLTYRCRGDGRRRDIRITSNGSNADADADATLVIRPISVSTPIFSDVVHGSALFSRGETQVLCTATLGAPREGRPVTNPFSSVSEREKIDPNLQKGPYYDLPIGSLRFLRSETALVSDYNSKKVKADRELTGDSGTFNEVQRAFLHYDFPAYSTGQVQKGGAAVANRRAIGHGTLAEKAILPTLPPPSLFPYAIRLTSEVTSSNGSSSMASVCGATVALLDAGVPILSPVAGVSVGLVMDPDKNDNDVDDLADLYTCLLDITGTEDHYGEMDFKIAGTYHGITAMQLDVKRPLPIEVLVRALYVAKGGRRAILKQMESQSQLTSYGIISKLKHRKHLKMSAPRVAIVRFDPLRKRDLIGPGGAVLRQMEDRFGISLDLTQEGQCLLYGKDADQVAKARSAVMDLVADVEEGEIYEGTVIEIKDFGAIVELLRNKEGLLHVSELSDDTSNSLRVDDSYGITKEHLTVGQKIDVLCIGVDTVQGSIKLSRKWLSTELHADPTSTSSINGGDDDFFASGEDKLSFYMDNEPKVEDTSSKLPKTQSNANAAHKTPPAPEQDDLSKLTRDDLKEKLRERGLKVKGLKVELIERLCDDGFFASGEDKLAFDIDNEPKVEDASSKLPKTQSNANAAAKTPLAPEQGDLSKLTRDDLKEILRERGLKVKGLKVELIERLQESEECDLSKLTKDDLKEKLRERGLKVSGIKVELIERLQESG